MPEVMLSLLGAPRLERDGSAIAVDTRKAIALLAYLAVTRQPHRRDALAALLWPDYDQEHARAALRRTLSTLTKALGGASMAAERETIGLPADHDLSLDVDDFHQHLAQCQTHDHPAASVCSACLEPLSAAATLYRDDFMAGFSLRDSPTFDDWQYFQRETLRRELASVLERLTRGHIATGRYDDAIAYARRWLALDRLHEPAHRYLMRLYAWSGQRASALRQYRECVQTLDQELGVAPLEATTRLYEAIKENRAPAPPARSQSFGTSRSDTAQVATMPADQPPSVPDTAHIPPRVAYPLVGRTDDWSAILRAYDAIHDDGKVVVLEGEAGIGKTRLAQEFAAYAERAGAVVVTARCYDGEASLPYAPLVAALRTALTGARGERLVGELPDRWLGEVARLLPEIAASRPGLLSAPPLDSPGAQSHFFEGIRQTLLAACRGARPGILFFDDVQWADHASLDALTYMARRLQGHPICLVLTWRGADAPASPWRHQLIAESQRSGNAAVIALARLSQADVTELLRASSGTAQSRETARRLYEETEGLPFFLVEYLLALSTGAMAADQRNWSVPGGVRELLRSRLSAIGGTSAQVLTSAAILGRWFDFDTVREVSGRGEEETVEALEDLAAQGLIHELREAAGLPPAYDFSHEKLRALVYDDTSLARRRLLHRRAAETLANALRRQRNGGGTLGQIAHHYLLAGDRAAAADYYKLAGERARSLYANAEALAHLGTALALGHPDAAALHEAIGDLHTVLGEYAAAVESYTSAATSAAPIAAARVERKLGNVCMRRGEWGEAQSHYKAAIAKLADSNAIDERARVYADWSLAAHRLGRLDHAWDLASQARELAASTQDARAMAQAHNILGVLASSRGNKDEAIRHLEQSLALAESADDADARAAALNNLALALAARGDAERAITHAQAALALCAVQGDRHHEAALHNNIADLLHAMGRPEDAMAHLKEAVSIYAEIGVEAGTVQPEIWKLTEW